MGSSDPHAHRLSRGVRNVSAGEKKWVDIVMGRSRRSFETRKGGGSRDTRTAGEPQAL